MNSRWSSPKGQKYNRPTGNNNIIYALHNVSFNLWISITNFTIDENKCVSWKFAESILKTV